MAIPIDETLQIYAEQALEKMNESLFDSILDREVRDFTTASASTCAKSDTITLEDIIKAKEMLDEANDPPIRPADPWPVSMPFGPQILVHEEPQVPKMQLSESVEVTEEFREWMNDQLIEKFGYREPILKDHAYMWGNHVIMKPEHYAMLTNVIA